MYKSENLGLNITDMAQDGNQYFNFDTDLAQNFLAIDNLALSQRHITNCTTKIPQNIKLTLENGVITLKKGSKLYKPNGAGNFQEIILNADVTRSNFDDSSNTILLFYNQTTNIIGWYTLKQNIYSGNTAPASPITQSVWYDTLNNVIKNTADAGRNWIETDLTLPFAIVTRTNGVVTSIDKVFNGGGIMASIIFATPGLQGLIPNGPNADGSSKTNKLELSSVILGTVTSNGTYPFRIAKTGIGVRKTYFSDTEPTNVDFAAWVNSAKNIIYKNSGVGTVWEQEQSFIGGWCTCENGIFTDISFYSPFHAVDFNDYNHKITELETRIAALETALAALDA